MDRDVVKSIHIKPSLPLFTNRRPNLIDDRPKSASYMARPYTPSGLSPSASNRSKAKLTFDSRLMTSPSIRPDISTLASPINRDETSFNTLAITSPVKSIKLNKDESYYSQVIASPVSPQSPSRRPMTVCINPDEINVGRAHKKMNRQGELRLRNIEKEQWTSNPDKVRTALIKAKRGKDDSKLHHTVISHHSDAFRNKPKWGKDVFVHDLYEPRRHEIFKGRAIWQGFCNDPMMSPSLGFVQR